VDVALYLILLLTSFTLFTVVSHDFSTNIERFLISHVPFYNMSVGNHCDTRPDTVKQSKIPCIYMQRRIVGGELYSFLFMNLLLLFTVVTRYFLSNVEKHFDIACSILKHVGVKITILCEPDRIQSADKKFIVRSTINKLPRPHIEFSRYLGCIA